MANVQFRDTHANLMTAEVMTVHRVPTRPTHPPLPCTIEITLRPLEPRSGIEESERDII